MLFFFHLDKSRSLLESRVNYLQAKIIQQLQADEKEIQALKQKFQEVEKENTALRKRIRHSHLEILSLINRLEPTKHPSNQNISKRYIGECS